MFSLYFWDCGHIIVSIFIILTKTAGFIKKLQIKKEIKAERERER